MADVIVVSITERNPEQTNNKGPCNHKEQIALAAKEREWKRRVIPYMPSLIDIDIQPGNPFG